MIDYYQGKFMLAVRFSVLSENKGRESSRYEIVNGGGDGG